MKKTLTIGLSALALTVAGTALAQQRDGMKADADGNGTITRAEAQNRADRMFAKMDVNNDGALTDADREARRAAMRTKMFDALDADKSGQISKTEFMSFKHDGKRGDHARMGKGMGHDGDHDRMGKGRRGGMMMMGKADTNNDGSISKAEFTSAAMSRFARADANNDGTVTAEERKAARDAMRTKWKEMKAQKAN